MSVESVIKVRTNALLIEHVAPLWIRPDDLVIDTTYGLGGFWRLYRPASLICHDLILDGVDFRHLPEPDNCADVVVFDPPYIPQGGRKTSTVPDMLNRFGLMDVPTTVRGMNELNALGMAEASRVLKPRGLLFVKCMDYVNSGKYNSGRHSTVSAALDLDMEQVDEFVHHSGTGPQPKFERNGCPRRQVHSRRAHSFLCVFRKPRFLRPTLDNGR